jgi:hypothetical protein
MTSYGLDGPGFVSRRGQNIFFSPKLPGRLWDVCGRLLAGIAGSNSAGGMEVCILSLGGLCDGLIPRPEESYRVYVCVTECDQVQH